MSIKLKLFLIIAALAQLGCLCSIFLGIVGGFDDTTSKVLFTSAEDTRELEHEREKINKTHKGEGELKDSSSSLEGVPDRVILMVIDALRVDMITPENFPFLLEQLKSYQSTGILQYQVTVDLPTVTLPRVKTLLTGKAPTYLDVLKNFQTSENSYGHSTQISEDNLIWALRREKPEINICFFGDETWLRLFPPTAATDEAKVDEDGTSQYFKKWEGVTSFFVKDFYEVDQNVTRNLDRVEDCQFLILHYLGLDHIGHVYGPYARPDLIKNKLNEMDKVVQKLHSLMNRGRSQEKSLMLITGDHGMANAGGHGGSSFEEVTTPLITLISGSQLLKNQKPIKPGINQVDFTPTLASLWGVKVPKESRGQLVLDIVEQFQSSQQLATSYQDNCEHLLKILGDSREAATYRLWWTEISKLEKPLSIKKFIELEQELGSALNDMKDSKSNLWGSFSTGILVLFIVEMILIVLLVNSVSKSWKGLKLSVFVAILPPLMIYFSSSFIEEEHYIRYFLYSAILLYYYCFTAPIDFNCLWILTKVLVIHRIAMTLNQTGDKWSHLPDLNDFIDKFNLVWISAFVGVILVHFYVKSVNVNSRIFSFCILSLLITRLSRNFADEHKESWIFRNVAENRLQQLNYFFILCNFAYMTYNSRSLRTSIFTSLLLLIMNLHRLQNFIVVGLLLTELGQINSLFDYQLRVKSEIRKNPKVRRHLISQSILIWFAHASFFYQGNSNGLATVDVSAGYVGVESFSSSILIGFLIFMNTYGSPLLIYLSSLCYHSRKSVDFSDKTISKHNGISTSHAKVNKKSQSKASNPLSIMLLLTNGAESIVYAFTLIVFRNHLFIWSVFVPKLMYLIAQSVMLLLVCMISMFIL